MKTGKKCLHVRVEEALRKIYRKGIVQPHSRLWVKVFARERKLKKLSWREVARRTGLRWQTIRYIEQRCTGLNTDSEVRLTLAIGYLPHELWFRVHRKALKGLQRMEQEGG